MKTVDSVICDYCGKFPGEYPLTISATYLNQEEHFCNVDCQWGYYQYEIVNEEDRFEDSEDGDCF